MIFFRAILTLLLLASIALITWQSPPAASPRQGASPAQGAAPATPPASLSGHRLAQGLQVKLNHIRQNGERSSPDQTPTVMTEDEINDYIAAGGIVLPQGVKKMRLEGRSGTVTAFLNVDFDQIRGGQNLANPMLSIFSGRHDVRVETDAAGSGREGRVHVRDVSIDGFTVPRMALEYFVSKYVTPKYPDIGLDSKFQMPNRIDLATVGYHKLTVTQK